MNYMLLVAETQADFDRRSEPVRAAFLGEAWKAYSDGFRKQSLLRSSQNSGVSKTANSKRRNGLARNVLFDETAKISVSHTRTTPICRVYMNLVAMKGKL